LLVSVLHGKKSRNRKRAAAESHLLFSLDIPFYGSRPEAPFQERETGTSHPAADRTLGENPAANTSRTPELSPTGVVCDVRLHDAEVEVLGFLRTVVTHHQAGAGSGTGGPQRCHNSGLLKASKRTPGDESSPASSIPGLRERKGANRRTRDALDWIELRKRRVST